MTLAELFPDGDYKFSLRFEWCEAAEFFAPTTENEKVLAERKHWLRTEPMLYAALQPDGEALLEETIEYAQVWSGFNTVAGSPLEKCIALGEFWEADFLVLKIESNGEIRLRGGCVCFPSSWRLTEKVGHPIEFIHEPVPGLNAKIGVGIRKFLTNALKPGLASLRHNWGLARSPELNHHPERGLPRLDATVGLEEVWVRIEHQALVPLPKSGGILFGIRLAIHPLAAIKADAVAATRLSRALESMPEPMAQYKGIATARGHIIQLLRG